ncbi:MAG: hypothetical protein NTX52_03475 [Planctomycetota bacterium]|nr:hypothetical protein [Planctomycetota bacterium]
MSYDPITSLQMGGRDLGSNTPGEVVSVRIEPDFKTCCCCSHCWPLVWQQINEHIHPQGPVEHEGRVLLKIGDERLVLESHESGPEIIMLVAASINLVTAVINLVTIICVSLSKERKRPSRISIVKRRLVKKKVSEEIVLQIDVAGLMSDRDMASLEKTIRKVLLKK